jgi:hypothetical protein
MKPASPSMMPPASIYGIEQPTKQTNYYQNTTNQTTLHTTQRFSSRPVTNLDRNSTISTPPVNLNQNART